MRYDPKRAQLEESELLRLRHELARLRTENERLAAMAARAGPTPATLQPGVAARARLASRERLWTGRAVTALLVMLAFGLGLVYADHLAQGEALRGFLVVWNSLRPS